MRFVITDNKRVGDWAAVYVANKIREFNPTAERKFVLGLPTGSTPLQMYKRLIELIKWELLASKMWLLSTWTNILDLKLLMIKAIIIICITISLTILI